MLELLAGIVVGPQTLALAGELREQDVSPAMRAELLLVFERWRSAE